MNWKPTVILLAIAAALYFFFAYYEVKQPNTHDATANAARLTTLERSDIDGLVITDRDIKIDIRRDVDRWAMKSPLADRADTTLVEQLLTSLETTHKEDTISSGDVSKGKLSDYGLQSPHEKLQIVPHDGKPVEMDFGSETAVDGKTYMQVAGQGEVFVVGDEIKKLLQKSVNDWRDHKVTNLAATDVTRFTIKNPAGEIELQRDGEHWKIAKPLAARGDDQKINDFVSQVTNLTVSTFVADDKADAAAYGLAEPRGTLTLYTAREPKGIVLMIGSTPTAAKPAAAASPAAGSPTPVPTPEDSKLADSVYARLPSRQSIYTVPKSVEAFLTLKPDDVRSRQLARLNADTVDRLHVTPADGQAFTVARNKDKGWTINDQPTNGATADTLIKAITGANAVDFVADSASDLAKYGLDKPALQVKFAAFASENTAESKAGEQTVATVDFGRVEGANVYARLEEEPFVVSVPKTLLDDVPTDPTEWQPTDIFKADPEKVSSLEVEAPDRPKLSLTRADKGEWKVASKDTPGPLDASRTQSTVNTLARLHAVRWVGAEKPTYGLIRPQETLTFAVGSDAKAGGKLEIGALSPEQMSYARVDGRPGVFLISRPDHDTLMEPLVPVPTPAPTPVPTVTPEPAASATPAIPATPTPMPVISTPIPTPEPTATPATPMSTPVATPTPTLTPEPTATPAPTPEPTATLAPTPMPTPVPTATPATPEPATPAPTATPEPTAMPATPEPSAAAPASHPDPRALPRPRSRR